MISCDVMVEVPGLVFARSPRISCVLKFSDWEIFDGSIRWDVPQARVRFGSGGLPDERVLTVISSGRVGISHRFILMPRAVAHNSLSEVVRSRADCAWVAFMILFICSNICRGVGVE